MGWTGGKSAVFIFCCCFLFKGEGVRTIDYRSMDMVQLTEGDTAGPPQLFKKAVGCCVKVYD